MFAERMLNSLGGGALPSYSLIRYRLQTVHDVRCSVKISTAAPDFTLDDVKGQQVSLSDFRGDKHVVLVFNRGFM